MKRVIPFLMAVGALTLLAGCEWEGSGSDNTWNDAHGWINFSGMYRDPAGQYLVREHGLSTPQSASQSLGTGSTNFIATFSGTLSHTPIVKGSVSVTDGNETFSDPSGSGTLTGNKGGTGSVNYQTGAVTVDFFSSPAPGNSIIASYQYFPTGTAENPQPGGSGVEIFTFNVTQTGNSLVFVDNHGAQYSGSSTHVNTAGGDDTGFTSGQLAMGFHVEGRSSSGQAITITGTFTGDYAAPAGTGQSGTLNNMTMQGTWIEESGSTGDIVGVAGSNTLTP